MKEGTDWCRFLLEVVDEILFGMIQLFFDKMDGTVELRGIWEIIGICHPKRIARHFCPKIHDSTTYRNLNFLNLIE